MLFNASLLFSALVHSARYRAGVQEPLCELSRRTVGRDCRTVVLWAGYMAWRNVLQESVSQR